MYSHISTEDHKNIAGIAYLQSKLKEVNPELKIDGMFGTESIAAFRDAIEQGLKIEDFRVDLKGTGIGLIQYMIRQAVELTKRTDFPMGRLHDNQWGDGTKQAIDIILSDALMRCQFDNVTRLFNGAREATKLSPETLKSVKSRIGYPKRSLTPSVYDEKNQLKEGTHWCVGMDFEVNTQTDELLAKALNFENPVVSINQMLASGYQIALEYYRGRAVAVIVVRRNEVIPFIPPKGSAPTKLHHGYIEGIYVNKNLRGLGIGTRLLIDARRKCEELGYKRVIFVRGPSEFTLEETLDGCRSPKDRIFDALINGHGFRVIATELDSNRPERCVYDLNKE